MNVKKWVRRQFKKKNRIYIWPTRMGGYFIGLIVLLFLLSIGYNNNLLLIFTLFLFSLNLMWVIQTHFYLHALRLSSLHLGNGHYNEEILVDISWKKTPEGSRKWNLFIETDDESLALRAIEHGGLSLKYFLRFPRRGLWEFSHLLVGTEMPFGLYRTWTFMAIEAKAYAYPARVSEFPKPLESLTKSNGDISSFEKGLHDIWNLAPHNQSESRRISWKHYARTGELLVKEGEELKSGEVNFKVRYDQRDKERLLSIMASQMVFCEKSHISFSLETPLTKLPSGSGEKHLHECLRNLSLC